MRCRSCPWPWKPPRTGYRVTLVSETESVKMRLSVLLTLNQQNSAADLSMLVLEVLEKSKGKVEDEILGL